MSKSDLCQRQLFYPRTSINEFWININTATFKAQRFAPPFISTRFSVHALHLRHIMSPAQSYSTEKSSHHHFQKVFMLTVAFKSTSWGSLIVHCSQQKTTGIWRILFHHHPCSLKDAISEECNMVMGAANDHIHVHVWLGFKLSPLVRAPLSWQRSENTGRVIVFLFSFVCLISRMGKSLPGLRIAYPPKRSFAPYSEGCRCKTYVVVKWMNQLGFGEMDKQPMVMRWNG